ncbi:MAG: N-acetylmuramoyl-L-alanine amidase [bacterium]
MKNRKKQQRLAIGLLTSVLVLVLALIGIFAVKMVESSQKAAPVTLNPTATPAADVSSKTESSSASVVTPTPLPTEPATPDSSTAPTQTPTPDSSTVPTEPTPAEPVVATKIVCIDPGHQMTQITDLEPMAPGSTEMKPGVTSGTEGVASGKTEYQVNLEVSLLLKDILEARGYQVVMTRTTNDVSISNVQRAQIATAANADIFVRIHCNGLDNPEISGVLCYGPSEGNPYLSQEIIQGSQRLCQLLRDAQCAATGQGARDNLFEDNMTGINWATMPVAIVEMGFMTNAQEDLFMASAEGQQKIATGLANGVDAYFAAG